MCFVTIRTHHHQNTVVTAAFTTTTTTTTTTLASLSTLARFRSHTTSRKGWTQKVVSTEPPIVQRTSSLLLSQSSSWIGSSSTNRQQNKIKSSSTRTLRNTTNSSSVTTALFPSKPAFANNKNIKEEDSSATSFSVAAAPTRQQQQQQQLQDSIQESEPSYILPFSKDVTTILKKPRVEVFVGMLVLLSSLLAALSTIDEMPLLYKEFLLVVEDMITYIFALEFVMRWYSSVGSKETSVTGYLAKPLVGVDILVVILPLLLPLIPYNPSFTGFLNDLPLTWLMSNTALINLRLLRILRLQRVLVNPESFQKFLNALGIEENFVVTQPYQLDLARVLLSIFTLLSVASGLIYTAEHGVNPAFPNYFTALYFGLTTLTTVGFGDITPITPEGKLVVCGSILAGVAIIPAQTASLVEALLAGQKVERKRKESLVDDTNESSMVMENTSVQEPSSSVLNGEALDLTTQAMVSKTTTMPIAADTSTTKAKSASPETTTIRGRQPQDGMIDTKTMCDSCGASFHWSSAAYCWSCGSKL